MIGSAPARSGPSWEQAFDPDAGWHDLVLAAAAAAEVAVGPLPERARLEALLRAHLPSFHDGGPDTEAAINGYGCALFDAAVLLGFSLARTWPGQAEDLAAWPARALEYAGLWPEPVPDADAAG